MNTTKALLTSLAGFLVAFICTVTTEHWRLAACSAMWVVLVALALLGDLVIGAMQLPKAQTDRRYAGADR